MPGLSRNAKDAPANRVGSGRLATGIGNRMTVTLTADALAAALEALAARDADLHAALAAVGPPPPRDLAPGFAGLVRIIIGQQVSAAVARVFWARMQATFDPLTPAALLEAPPQALRALGLSQRKAEYAQALAAEVLEGRLDLERLPSLDDEQAIAELVRLRGIGRWTAEIYLLFALGRLDVWPAADLALAVALQRLKRLKLRPDPERVLRLARPWRPYRGAAAHLLWHYYARTPISQTAPPAARSPRPTTRNR